VRGAEATTQVRATSGFAAQVINAATGSNSVLAFQSNSVDTARITALSTSDLLFATGSANTERLRLDSSGNLGLGVVPSAWGGTNTRSLDISLWTSIANGNAFGSALTFNGFYNGSSWIYKQNNTAAKYELDGAHRWFTAPSGTAGNAISFTQAMTLDASSNLSVEGQIYAAGGRGVTKGFLLPDWRMYNGSSGNTLVFNNGSDRVTIDSSGNLLVGTTSSLGTAGKVQFVQAAAGSAGTVISADATSATFSYSVAWFAANRSASSDFNFINCTSDQYSAPQFRVQGNGVILAQNTSVQSISDARTKENIRDATDGLQVILGLQPRRFDFKKGFGNGRKNVLGFVAQEIETVFPDAVSCACLDPDSKEVAYKTVGPGELIPVLVKAIQEQQTLIEALTARITALESA
jgi:hypothetical protein